MADRSKVVFVTGASRGIGRLLALALAESGATVVGFARSSDALDSLAEEAVPGSTIHARPVDVTSPMDVRSALEQATLEIGPPSALITCAGSSAALGPISAIDPEQWWRDVTIDLRGTMLCAQAVLGPMLQAGSGRIVTVYGNLGDHGMEHVSAFAAGKAGIVRFTETLASELVDTGVVALAIHPGFVRTPMTERLAWSEEGRQWLPAFKPHAEQHWGDGASAVALIERILGGEADELAGRVVHVGDDLERLSERARADDDFRRLRIRLDS
ncbi:MAG TPA: SDR family oxidoreductase [Acidimicrobiia bacterium]|nr:SDR family oxidoreductase [Acidimicrobiia bacterium]